MREIEWAAFHFIEDENAEHKYLKSHLDLLLSFINPKAFKDYHAATDASHQIENEAFEAELKSKGVSMERFNEAGRNEQNYKVEEIDPSLDVIG